MRWLLSVIVLALLTVTAGAVECRDVSYDSNSYTICEVAPASEDLRLFRLDQNEVPYGDFAFLSDHLNRSGKSLLFAMNAGMYHEDRSPVGHYIEDDVEQMRIIATEGPGNFGLLPNGVFCVGNGWARVFETRAYQDSQPDCRHASQSGPMLVVNGSLHPAFLPDSTSRYVRNGVGTSPDGTRVVFAISNNTVTFHEFASLFRDKLDLPDALFFDGNVSRLYARDLDRHDLGRRMGPIVAVVGQSRN